MPALEIPVIIGITQGKNILPIEISSSSIAEERIAELTQGKTKQKKHYKIIPFFKDEEEIKHLLGKTIKLDDLVDTLYDEDQEAPHN